jgi:rare lipoprotein A
MRQTLLTAVVLAVALFGCGEKKKVRAAPPPPPPGRAAAPTPYLGETGIASWYGHPYHGRAAASGEIYDMEQMTAAHRTLPFGAQIRVYNLTNEKTVDVRINDRGPFVDGRIIDLSHAAARTIGMIGPGTATVRLEMISAPAAIAAGYYGVQVGAFKVRDNAERLQREMEAQHGACRMVLRAGDPPLWRVLVGRETTIDGAAALAQQLRQENHGVMGQAFVVRLDAAEPAI